MIWRENPYFWFNTHIKKSFWIWTFQIWQISSMLVQKIMGWIYPPGPRMPVGDDMKHF